MTNYILYHQLTIFTITAFTLYTKKFISMLYTSQPIPTMLYMSQSIPTMLYMSQFFPTILYINNYRLRH
jgi:hypothetical protein